jgi:hypothetical protein
MQGAYQETCCKKNMSMLTKLRVGHVTEHVENPASLFQDCNRGTFGYASLQYDANKS